ncbi:MAG TPA: hypothetical protein VEJ84_17080 [Acidimicrobiales bacterium]|nr:hypothetical protein [Acidimicrobiales bacterium]
MGEQASSQLRHRSSELVERGDIDGLTVHVNDLVAGEEWAELDALRTSCRLALARGKQLWGVAAHIEYRLCLEAPGPWAAKMLEAGTGRFALGPLPEVAASTHTWSELSPYLHPTPEAAMAAHERVLRGDDLADDSVAASLPEVLDIPLRLEGWEPSYALAEYHTDRMDAPSPRMPPLRPASGRPAARSRGGGGRGVVGTGAGNGSAATRGVPDEVSASLEDLVTAWTAESNGRAEAVSVRGKALDAVSALGARLTEVVELAPGEAVAAMAWAAASGGAHGRRPGAAPGRFAAWWVLATIGGLTANWPLRPDELTAVLGEVRWYAWGSGEPVTGWALRLACEATSGSRKGRAWAISATDAA